MRARPTPPRRPEEEGETEGETQPLTLLHLPQPLLAHVLGFLGEAGAVVRSASACKLLWAAAACSSSPQLERVDTLELRCYHHELQHRLPALARLFPRVERLRLPGCSALPEAWLAAGGAERWRLRELDVTRLWSWRGASLGAWAPTLTRLVLDDTSFPLLSPPGAAEAAAARTGRLRHLQLRRLANSPVACSVHSRSECDCGADTVLSALLAANTALTSLDLAGNDGLPDRLLRWALGSGSSQSLELLDLSGCRHLRPGAYLADCCPRLQRLQLASTATGDADVARLAALLEQLTWLSLNACRQVSDGGIAALSAAPAVAGGRLAHLDVGRLTRTTAPALLELGRALVDGQRAAAPLPSAPQPLGLHLVLSHTAGVSDAVVAALAGAGRRLGGPGMAAPAAAVVAAAVPDSAAAAGPEPGVQLTGLELAGLNGVSAEGLQQLAAAQALAGLRHLDLSDIECLGRQPRAAAGSPAALAPQPWDDAGAESAALVGALSLAAAPSGAMARTLSCCGAGLADLRLDGCYLDDEAAALVGQRCPSLRRLSLVGCRGLGTSGLRALTGGCRGTLQSLAVGGSRAAWAEAEGLSALTGLTELRVLRRPRLRDAQLSPLLEANAGLRRVALVACYSLTDELFVLAARGGGGGGGRGGGPAQLLQHVEQLELTACDGITGASLALLGALRHLRVAHCSFFTLAAAQRVAVGCSRLSLLELPSHLEQQLTSFKFGGLPGAAAAAGPKSQQPPARLADALPLQGPGGHLQGLRVVVCG